MLQKKGQIWEKNGDFLWCVGLEMVEVYRLLSKAQMAVNRMFFQRLFVAVAYNPLLYFPCTVTILLGGDFMIKERLGNRIRELRQKTGLSQEKFALKIGMDRTYFASVEAGKRNIAIVNLEKIANGLEVSLSELFKGV